MQWTMLQRSLLATAVLVTCAAPAAPDSPAPRASDRTLEMIGSVLNTGSTSAQYGYISSLDGLAGIFAGSPENETTALLTFYSDTTTLRVINNGPLRIVNREGTMTVYRHDQPHGDFGKPDSFRAGTPVMLATLRHQVILDTVTNQFTTIFVNSITSSVDFTIAGRHYNLGKPGEIFRTTVFGRPSTSGPGQYVIAGYTAGMAARSVEGSSPR
jgi:hypothetical protein